CRKDCHEIFLLGACLRELPGYLLNLDDDELGRVERREAHQDVHDAQVNTGLRIILGIAFHEVSLRGAGALERALEEESLHEGADIEADLAPERRVVRLEDNPLCAVVEAGFDVERETPDRYVFPLGAGLIVALQRASTPDH